MNGFRGYRDILTRIRSICLRHYLYVGVVDELANVTAGPIVPIWRSWLVVTWSWLVVPIGGPSVWIGDPKVPLGQQSWLVVDWQLYGSNLLQNLNPHLSLVNNLAIDIPSRASTYLKNTPADVTLSFHILSMVDRCKTKCIFSSCFLQLTVNISN